jgi:hypothetical protein
MKALSAGSEIDAWCTKCRLDLGHRIVALVAGVPKRVICQTCGGEHAYHAPRSLPAKAGVFIRRPNAPAATEKRPQPAGVRAAQRARVEQERYDAWAERTLGRTVDAFKRYSMDLTLAAGELVLHPKFGEGYVDAVREDGKVSVMFRDGARTLAHRAR